MTAATMPSSFAVAGLQGGLDMGETVSTESHSLRHFPPRSLVRVPWALECRDGDEEYF